MARKKPSSRKQRVENRSRDYKRSNDKVKNISVGLMDMDAAIMYYFNEVIKPTVTDNGESVEVPVMYASAERWSSIKNKGYLRDNKKQLILPLIVFRRTGLAKNDTLPVDKLDANNPQLHYTFERKYSPNNRYDNFSAQQNLIPQREYYNVAMPDYVTITYDFIIWTSYIEQMNKIVEKVNWSDGSYWGEPGKLKFRTAIDSFSDATEVSDQERSVKTEFSITLNGYLIPEDFNNKITTQKYLTPKRLVIGNETDVPLDSLVEVSHPTSTLSFGGGFAGSISSLTITQGTGVAVSNTGVGYDGQSDLTQIISIGQSVDTGSTVQFNIISASAVHLGTNSIDLTENGVEGDWNVIGELGSTGNLHVDGNATIDGILTAQEFHSEYVSASIIYESGSTKFGDTQDDTHEFTGSLSFTGSFNINDTVSITSITTDTSLSSSSATNLVTENAIKSYVDNIVDINQVFLRKQYTKFSSGFIGDNTASFNAITASAPAPLTSTTEHDFIFFINGQYMEHDAISIQQNGSSFHLQVDTDSIGYVLESDDEIMVSGKFNS
jgi:hypothetical protein